MTDSHVSLLSRRVTASFAFSKDLYPDSRGGLFFFLDIIYEHVAQGARGLYIFSSHPHLNDFRILKSLKRTADTAMIPDLKSTENLSGFPTWSSGGHT